MNFTGYDPITIIYTITIIYIYNEPIHGLYGLNIDCHIDKVIEYTTAVLEFSDSIPESDQCSYDL